MEEGYIEEKTWIKCTIDDITYDCYFKYERHRILNKPWVEIIVRKYHQKKWWFIEWWGIEFEYEWSIEIDDDDWEWINQIVYFSSENVKLWVKCTLNRREEKILQKKAEVEKQKNLKILKEI